MSNDLTGPGPCNEAWIKFCGGLDPRTLPADRRLRLWAEFQQQRTVPDRAIELRRLFTQRRGGDENAWPLQAKAQLRDVEGPPKIAPLKLDEGVPAARAEAVQQAHRDRARLLQSVALMRTANAQANAHGDSLNLRTHREKQIEKALKKVQGLSYLYPELAAL